MKKRKSFIQNCDSSKILSNYLRMLRCNISYCQADVAEYVGLSRQTITGYETGASEPPVDSLVRLADFYQVPFSDLVLLLPSLAGASNEYLPSIYKERTYLESTIREYDAFLCEPANQDLLKGLSNTEQSFCFYLRKLSTTNQQHALNALKYFVKHCTQTD